MESLELELIKNLKQTEKFHKEVQSELQYALAEPSVIVSKDLKKLKVLKKAN
jgi:hypothetical protein